MSAAPQHKPRSRFRGKGLDPAELARAEESLRSSGDAELSREWIDATVARVTGAARRRFRLVTRLSVAAAVLLLSVLMIASRNMLWPAQQYSISTLEYPIAVRMLASSADSEEEHLSALKKVHSQVALAIRVLQNIKDDPTTDSSVVAAAQRHLAAVRQATETPTSSLPRLGCAEVKDLAKEAEQSRLDTQQCLMVMDRLSASVITGILVMRQMPSATDEVLKIAAGLVRSLGNNCGR
jgi:hypothetical protein